MCLRNFGYRMAELTGSSFTFNKQKNMFFGPQIADGTCQDLEAQVKMVECYLSYCTARVKMPAGLEKYCCHIYFGALRLGWLKVLFKENRHF